MTDKDSARIFAKAGDPPATGRSWYRIDAKANVDDKPRVIEIFLYEEIGLWGISANQFIKDFQAIDDGRSPVIVAINSVGGNAYDAFALN